MINNTFVTYNVIKDVFRNTDRLTKIFKALNKTLSKNDKLLKDKLSLLYDFYQNIYNYGLIRISMHVLYSNNQNVYINNQYIHFGNQTFNYGDNMIDLIDKFNNFINIYNYYKYELFDSHHIYDNIWCDIILSSPTFNDLTKNNKCVCKTSTMCCKGKISEMKGILESIVIRRFLYYLDILIKYLSNTFPKFKIPYEFYIIIKKFIVDNINRVIYKNYNLYSRYNLKNNLYYKSLYTSYTDLAVTFILEMYKSSKLKNNLYHLFVKRGVPKELLSINNKAYNKYHDLIIIAF